MLTLTEQKELAASALEASQFMCAAASRKFAAGEITYSEKLAKEAYANSYYIDRLDWVAERAA